MGCSSRRSLFSNAVMRRRTNMTKSGGQEPNEAILFWQPNQRKTWSRHRRATEIRASASNLTFSPPSSKSVNGTDANHEWLSFYTNLSCPVPHIWPRAAGGRLNWVCARFWGVLGPFSCRRETSFSPHRPWLHTELDWRLTNPRDVSYFRSRPA